MMASESVFPGALPEDVTRVEAKSGLSDRVVAVTFAATILVAAFLLFQVQPLIGKYLLPWFGGAPGVWTACLLFFQAILFGGYLYAHLLNQYLGLRAQLLVHGSIVLGAMATLPIIPAEHWKPQGEEWPVGAILLLLLMTVGPTYFVLSATSPLVQSWFSRRFAGRSPYRLYALSNFGSMAALLSFPLMFEPNFEATALSWLWSGFFVAFAVLCLLSGKALWSIPPGGAIEQGESSASGETFACFPASCWLRAAWLGLPAIASLMLLATTNHICEDVAVVPFLWVIPLALYLLSFIICFDHPRWYVRPFWAVAALASLLAVVVLEEYLPSRGEDAGFVASLTGCLSAMFCIAMVCHGELARLKPDPRELTSYYLSISAGGAAGGLFVALAAPAIFTGFWEWELGLALSIVVAAVVTFRTLPRAPSLVRFALGSAAAAGLAGLAAAAWQSTKPVESSRSFFGVVSVREYDIESPDHQFALKHGWVTHGRQFADPQKARLATAYYGPESGVGQVIERLARQGPIRVGVVGLGIGTLSVYARPGDYYRFYEINPDVIRLARARFTPLAQCKGTCEVVQADARLALEREEPQRLDLLVLDAFSGASPPSHLLTKEAFAIYLRHLRPGGAIAVNVTNYYLKMAPVVRGQAEHYGLEWARVGSGDDESRLIQFADWMVLCREASLTEGLRTALPPPTDDGFSVPLWTDRFSNLFQIL